MSQVNLETLYAAALWQARLDQRLAGEGRGGDEPGIFHMKASNPMA
ncbi:hypothetical protein [Aliiroseovarius crassostreae]|nr:hypothetical protein [Aliiroseovarius crassostreae]